MSKDYIKSYSFNQKEIIKNIQTLHTGPWLKGWCDPCFSRGGFYDINNPSSWPEVISDINPPYKFVEPRDCRDLGFADDRLSGVVFDPPFLASRDPSLQKSDKSNLINKRFSVYPTEKELFQFYMDSLREFYRVLHTAGWLVMKIQNKVSSGKQYWSRIFIQNYAEQLGFYLKDEFILLTKNRPVPEWQKVNQKRARKHHCFFLVFQKRSVNVEYT